MKHVILGAGGHARVLLEALRSMRKPKVAGFTDPALKGRRVDGLPVLGGDEALAKLPPRSTVLVNGLGTSRPALRRRLFEELSAKGYLFPPVLSAAAYCAAGVELAEGAQVLTRAVLHPGARIGRNAVVNTGAIVEHDCVVGDHAFVGPGAVLCGEVRLGEGAFIGAGAVVLPGVSVGRGAVVGAGAVAAKDVRADATVVGVPAKERRK